MLGTEYVKPILREMYALKSELVPCFIGDPGIGKTQGLYEFAEEIGVKVVTFILSNTVPSEVSGIRMPDKESKTMEVFDDMRMASLQDGDILFFDEILEAPPMLWSACLTLIQDRIMASGRKLPDVFIVAASNPVASPAIIPASTRDRFQFIELRFDWNHWCKWFKEKYNVVPNERFKNRITGDSSRYNILTPRRITKLYEWLKDDPSNLYRQAVVSDMFDEFVTVALMEMIRGVLSPKEQIIQTLEQSNININLPDDYNTMSLKEIFEVLQQMDEWKEIEYLLASTELVKPEEHDDSWEIRF
mgnify:CR=1 FL=1